MTSGRWLSRRSRDHVPERADRTRLRVGRAVHQRGRPGRAPARRRTSCTAPGSPPACSRSAATTPPARAAARRASISAWAVGSPSRLPVVGRGGRAPRRTGRRTTAPTGTSPVSSATRGDASSAQGGGGGSRGVGDAAGPAVGRLQLPPSSSSSHPARLADLGDHVGRQRALVLDQRDQLPPGGAEVGEQVRVAEPLGVPDRAGRPRRRPPTRRLSSTAAAKISAIRVRVPRRAASETKTRSSSPSASMRRIATYSSSSSTKSSAVSAAPSRSRTRSATSSTSTAPRRGRARGRSSRRACGLARRRSTTRRPPG